MPSPSKQHRAIPIFPILLSAFSLTFFAATAARADTAAFDLAGPRVEMTVARAGEALPIAAVPNLQPGDRLWIHPDLPEDQSVHYLLVVAFLRGTTNPPPENWFTRAETWNKQVRTEGILVTVPAEAQQALLFLAPETGGDFSTLRNAVRGKPGAFVRASQDLNQASLDRTRVDKYLAEVKQTSDVDPSDLHDRSVLLTRTLSLRLNEQCFDKPAEQQASCLTQNTDQLVLDDGHSQSMVAALTSGPSTDLIGAVSATPLAGGGSFSPYVGAIVDMARVFGSMHTAVYQYIPALTLPNQRELNLRLNNPPSFRNPKSVLVVGLPAVEAAQLPPLRAVSPDDVFCLQKSPLILPVQGAPLVFSTGIAHDFVLHLAGKSGKSIDLPATPDAASGGFVVDVRAIPSGALDADFNGSLRGTWGFDSVNGPAFHLRSAHSTAWQLAPTEQGALIVGRDDAIQLKSDCAPCVNQVSLKDSQGKDLAAKWKATKADEIEVQVQLKDAAPGTVKLRVEQFGLPAADELPLHTYSEAAHLDAFKINAGDQQGELTGTRLDQVDSFELNGVRFVPAKLTRVNQKDDLSLAAASASAGATLQPQQTLMAHVALKDGRVLDLQTSVEPARPKMELLSKNVQLAATISPVRLKNPDELPQDGKLSFVLKSDVPDKFPQTEKIEVATTDGSFDTLLSLGDDSVILQDSETVLAVLDPLKNLGASAFGALHFRPVDSESGKGDWQPLATLVRIPSLKDVRCPDSPDKQCRLNGAKLFLIDSVASDPQFNHSVPVPVGFINGTLNVPRPNGTLLYIKLRDDPASVNVVALPVLPDEP